MLIQFTVGNFLSFKEKVTLSMVKANLTELPENIIPVNDDMKLLKSAVIYGANANGKSNLIKALQFMNMFTILSFKNWQADQEIGISSFLLNTETKDKPSFFEMVFIIENQIYRYGFELDNKRVKKEWLYFTPKNKEEKLFSREGSHIDLTEKFSEGKNCESKTRDNSLFLSVVSQFNGEIALKVIRWFAKLRTNLFNEQTVLRRTLSRLEEEPALKKDILNFISVADNKIVGFEVQTYDLPAKQTENELPQKSLKKKIVSLIRKIFNKKNEEVGEAAFLLDYEESNGTKKLFAFSVPILDAIKNGEILIIDELENHLHPLLLKHIIKLFNSSYNTNNAQLIFTTHSLTCMNNECFRRDQIWFTEKNSFGETSLFSLAEYKIEEKKIRKDASYSKDYLLGKYGAVPFIEDINSCFKDRENETSK